MKMSDLLCSRGIVAAGLQKEYRVAAATEHGSSRLLLNRRMEWYRNKGSVLHSARVSITKDVRWSRNQILPPTSSRFPFQQSRGVHNLFITAGVVCSSLCVSELLVCGSVLCNLCDILNQLCYSFLISTFQHLANNTGMFLIR